MGARQSMKRVLLRWAGKRVRVTDFRQTRDAVPNSQRIPPNAVYPLGGSDSGPHERSPGPQTGRITAPANLRGIGWEHGLSKSYPFGRLTPKPHFWTATGQAKVRDADHTSKWIVSGLPTIRVQSRLTHFRPIAFQRVASSALKSFAELSRKLCSQLS